MIDVHLTVLCHGSFPVSSAQLGIGIHDQGLLSPGVDAQQVQEAQEPTGP